MGERKFYSPMAPKGSRTPVDLWWVVIIVVAVAGVALDWSVWQMLWVSVAAAVVLGAGHLLVVWRRRQHSGRGA